MLSSYHHTPYRISKSCSDKDFASYMLKEDLNGKWRRTILLSFNITLRFCIHLLVLSFGMKSLIGSGLCRRRQGVKSQECKVLKRMDSGGDVTVWMRTRAVPAYLIPCAHKSADSH